MQYLRRVVAGWAGVGDGWTTSSAVPGHHTNTAHDYVTGFRLSGRGESECFAPGSAGDASPVDIWKNMGALRGTGLKDVTAHAQLQAAGESIRPIIHRYETLFENPVNDDFKIPPKDHSTRISRPTVSDLGNLLFVFGRPWGLLQIKRPNGERR